MTYSDWAKSQYTELRELECNGKLSLHSARVRSSGDAVSFWRIGISGLPESVLDAIVMELQHIKDYQHPALVKITNVYAEVDDLYVYIEMEPINCTLKDYANQHINTQSKVPEQAVWDTAGFLLEGLSYLHLLENPTPFLSTSSSSLMDATNNSRSVNIVGVHASITSSTVLVTQEGLIKFGIFGLSATLGELYSFGYYDVPHCFRAPEVTKYKHSLKSDVWALGATLVDMCVGTLSSHDDFPVNPGSLEHPDLSDYLMQYTSKLKKFLGVCLRFDVTKRHLTSGLIDELASLKPNSM
ncbi:Kinase, NEK [Giardia lamblia P15]|uniref:non-specific serine/threonine protein kinase n=1 Tax=Giardia intestinalis (strain P15) TaxID=658858 RepID=E1EWQ0_GIAIA|nr:Kinase, NEK [Giardia lamblia P15]